ncbi:hypothetical protein FOZ63_015837 [Perkinsus olseni]|uniref:Uncharacterized protein n=1 Tax=Perkinsus olseni TaxID=32597 RepID=A0A7J6SQJ9_PEROL|nr:hypothetical protein FOZ63_015837 [Perkinsus olseni]KAF4734410.1 hypothetical protein FOZ62_016918 [Perkinsus olseni]
MFYKLIAVALLAVAQCNSILENITVEPPGTWAQHVNGTNPYTSGSEQWLQWELGRLVDDLRGGTLPPESTSAPPEPSSPAKFTTAPPQPTHTSTDGGGLRARRSSDGYRTSTVGWAACLILLLVS